MNQPKINKAILKTISWFDLFDRPITLQELSQYLYQVKTSRQELQQSLANLVKARTVSQKNNLFFWAGGRGLRQVFWQGRYYRNKKIAFLKKEIVPLLSRVPHLKFIGITGSIAYQTAKKNSDIDLFIITSSNRLWTARFFTNLFLDRHQLRRPGQKNRICVNFYVSENSLNLKKIFSTTYDRFWLATLMPICGNRYNNLIAENDWIKKYFPNHNFKNKTNPLPFSMIKKSLEMILKSKMGDRFEKYIYQKQKKIIRKNSRRLGNEGLILNKNIAKIHFENLGKRYEKKFRSQKTLQNFN